MINLRQTMKNSLRSLLLATTLLSAAGCATYVPLASNTPPLTLTRTEERSSDLGLKVLFPAGDYVADFANKDGTFYLAPASVMFSNFGTHTPMRGGIFIPAIGAKDQRQAAWKQLASDDAIGGLLSSGVPSIHLYPPHQPVPFAQNRLAQGQPVAASRAGNQ